jgi:transposase-like protein
LWAKAGAVGNADALSTASRPVREAHRPQVHRPAGAERAGPLPPVFQRGGDGCENELARYGQKFKERAVARLLPPESAAAEAVAREIGVSVDTLERWRSEALAQPTRGRVWTAAARLEAVIATAVMDEAARAAWCRAQGVYPQQLGQWREAAAAALAEPQEARTAPSQAKQDRRRIKELERELRRKEKALAEAAALLVLSKKLEAIFPKDKGEAE